MCQTYKIAICDDFAADRKYLSSLCERWSRHNCYRIQISEFTSAENFLFYYAEKKDFDILLLDIEMGAMDGVTMAHLLAVLYKACSGSSRSHRQIYRNR